MNNITKRETISEGKFLRLVRISYRDNEGNPREWEAVERTTGTDIVSVIPVTDDGKIILVKQFRPPVGKMVIEFPAGLRDKGESLEDTALRETQEETGYRAGRTRELFAGSVSAGLSDEFLTIFLATDLKFVGKKDEQEERGITVCEVPLEEVNEWLDSEEEEGAFTDVKIRAYISYIKEV
ncbi:MAG: NUDIX hydrolase [Patescibacteria group bacterium]|nr:NUDIX hydrolase [Patescibacteria group bacterium]